MTVQETAPAPRRSRFPQGFLWGTGTAAYQIEGATGADGRGESIWDRFCATPGNVRGGDSGAVACDFYHRYPSDIRLMRELGANAFRFSVAWPRILPEGRGRVNQPGLDFYDRLVDELLAQEIEPLVTLYHWDLPTPLEDAGGWPSRATVDSFAELVELVVARLGDRVPLWLTQNEPWVVAWLGYGLGIHAPGRRSTADAVAAGHHALLAHGRALEILRRDAPRAHVGITLDLEPAYPASDDAADLAAAQAFDGERNRWFLDPVLRGAYPADVLEARPSLTPPVMDGDLELIAAPTDFLGINYYQRRTVAHARDGGYELVHREQAPHTAMGWEVSPDGLVDLLGRISAEYAPPAIVITENGAAYADVRAADGSVDDPERLAYLEEHVRALDRALELGVPVRGYFHWTLLDNFEWAEGYARRFGLVYVDFETQERVPKSSFHWYRSFLHDALPR